MRAILFQLRVSACVVILAGLGCTLQAQQPSYRQIDKLEPTTAPRTNWFAIVESTEAQESGDLGREVILQRARPQRLFEVSSDTQFLYDDNILLAPDDATNAVQLSDGVVFQTFNASFTPQLIPNLRSAIYLRYQLVRYEHHDELDFDGQALGIVLSYPLTSWLHAHAGWMANRLVQDSDDEEFYEEFDTQFGLRAVRALGDRVLLHGGYQFDWRPTSPAIFNRIENSGYLGADYKVMDRLTAQLLYRLRFGWFYDGKASDRRDLENLVSFALIYRFCDYASLRPYVQFADGESNQDLFDYDVVNAGGGLNLSFRF